MRIRVADATRDLLERAKKILRCDAPTLVRMAAKMFLAAPRHPDTSPQFSRVAGKAALFYGVSATDLPAEILLLSSQYGVHLEHVLTVIMEDYATAKRTAVTPADFRRPYAR